MCRYKAWMQLSGPCSTQHQQMHQQTYQSSSRMHSSPKMARNLCNCQHLQQQDRAPQSSNQRWLALSRPVQAKRLQAQLLRHPQALSRGRHRNKTPQLWPVQQQHQCRLCWLGQHSNSSSVCAASSCAGDCPACRRSQACQRSPAT